MDHENPIIVVAAVIRQEGRILICRRRKDQDHGGKWEFPGGKLEPGEQPHEALQRELQEELRIAPRVGEEIKRHLYSYPGRGPIQLIFFDVAEFFGEPDYTHFHETAWATPEELPRYDFLDGDIEFVKELAGGLVPSPGPGGPA